MKRASPRRPKLPPISEQMKAWSAALEGETGEWPGVSTRAFFGFAALYRRDRIFALLPRTRGMETANSLAFKLRSPGPRQPTRLRQGPRIGFTQMKKARWFTFELSCDADLRDALDWVARAYEAAGKALGVELREKLPRLVGRVSSGYTCGSNERSKCVTSTMGSGSPTARISTRHRAAAAPIPRTMSRYDQRLAEILVHATDVFCKKGYEGASMRDLSRVSGMSLAGLYYYFESKERLLFLIQKHTFSTIVRRLKARLDGVGDSEQRIRIFVLNHLEYFLANQAAMKVLTHEAEVLKNGFAADLAAIKREYYRICLGLLDDLKRDCGLQFSSRIAVLSLFGMMNWIYTWHNPHVDADAEHIAREMSDIFLRGVLPSGKGRK